jgi:hypothetical protein
MLSTGEILQRSMRPTLNVFLKNRRSLLANEIASTSVQGFSQVGGAALLASGFVRVSLLLDRMDQELP